MDHKKAYEVFTDLAQIMSASRNLDYIYTAVTGLIISSMNFHTCAIIMKNEHEKFSVTAVSGLDRAETIELLYKRCSDNCASLINGILEDKKTVVLDTAPECLPASKGNSKTILSPIFCKGKGIGVLIAETDSFSELSLQLIDSISRYASIGIENHILYRESMEEHMELAHKIETLQLMYEIGKEVISNLKTEEIIETVVQMIRRIIPCDGATVALFEPDRNVLYIETSWGTGMDKGATFDKKHLPFFSLMETGKSFYEPDITREFSEYPKLAEWASDKNVFSYFCVPLSVKGSFLGILILSSVRPAWFTDIHLTTAEKIATQVGIALENARLMEDIEEIFIGTVTSLVATIDAKSQWTKGHSMRVAKYTIELGEKIGLKKDALERLQLAAILHDIGKIGTYEAILDKPGKLTAEEADMIRKHPSLGADILMPLKAFRTIIPVMKHHHERYDGTGYPDGLAGDDIPIEARMLALSDVYDAMRSDRPYRRGLSLEEAVRELEAGAATQFDPALVPLFIEVIRRESMQPV